MKIGKRKSEPKTTAVVVGAGIAGLIVARALARAGISTTVLEARDAPGGAVRSHRIAGLTLDAGAESFATRGGYVADLLADMGMAEQITSPDPTGAWVQLPDDARPMPHGGVLGIPAHPWSAGIRRTLGTVGAARACLDLVLPGKVGAGGSLRDQVGRRMGYRVVDRLVHPVVGGVYGADPADVTLAGLAPHLTEELPKSGGSLARAVRTVVASMPSGASTQGLEGGLYRLTNALVEDVEAHGGEIKVFTEVSKVTRDDDGWVVTTNDDERRADLVVLASAMLGGIEGLEDVALDEGRPSTLVTLVLDDGRLDAAPRGTGMLVAPGSPVEAKALTHSTVKWSWLADQAGPGRHVLRVSYEGDRMGKWNDENRQRLRDAALVDAGRMLGLALSSSQLAGYDVVVWTQSMPRPSAAHREAVAKVKALAQTTDHLAVTGSWVAGTGLAAVVADAVAVGKVLVDEES
ncbi:MAG: FAD-dependent oxidoreductase [Micrococcales bacterium]|nr:FAD-dependent oxidoreductase [Micrococcales bacterium]MCL2668137.1 FAD-dependent oxidoreductase [Micrococcales bacterium]